MTAGNQDWVEFVTETAQMYVKYPDETTIRASWDFDAQRRRGLFTSYAEFRQHVLNLYDAELSS